MCSSNTATHALATAMQLQNYVEEEGGKKQQHIFVYRKNTFRNAEEMCQNSSNFQNVFVSKLKVNKMKVTGVTYVPLIVLVESNKNVEEKKRGWDLKRGSY